MLQIYDRRNVTHRWETFSLFEQLGNIGAEVARTRHWQGKDPETFWRSVERTLALFNRTLDDPRWASSKKREILRARDVFCDAVAGGSEYKSSLEHLMNYLLPYACLARKNVV